MTTLAVLLLTIGITDTLTAPENSLARRLGTALLVLIAISAFTIDWTSVSDAVLVFVCAAVVLSWLLTVARAERTGASHAVPVIVLAASVAVLVGLSGFSSPPSSVFVSWLTWLDLPPLDPGDPDRVLLAAGVTVVQIGTGNTIVRLVLSRVGAVLPPGRAQPSDRLKGGRVLGPMERITILALASAGQLAAAGLVVAAKGLVRFPELTASRRRSGPSIDAVTEYFLVGTFCSWMVSLTGLALLSLT